MALLTDPGGSQAFFRRELNIRKSTLLGSCLCDLQEPSFVVA